MKREKFNILNIILDKTIFGFLIVLISLTLNFAFSQNSFAEYYKATLSASVNENTAVIDGTEAIESSSETAEHAINLKVKTTNKTGYTATLSAKTDETALLNTNPAITTKISSISSVSSLSNLPANTWGYSFNTNTDFNPIPALSTPANLIHTTEKSTDEENHTIKLGMKLNSSLKPGNYENKLIISVVSNPYTPKAIMTEGPDFNAKLKALETATNKIEHFKKSPVAPAASMNAVNIDDDESECEIKLWLDPTDKTAYYYTEPGKVYLNKKSNEMFFSKSDEQKIKNILEIDLSNFDTSEVTNMGGMFYGMSNLTTLNVSHFDTSKVTDMSLMFHGMRDLSALNLSSFNTSQVTDMHNMFYGMSNLTTLDLSNFDTSKVTNMGLMFYGMSNVTALDLSNFDTSKVTNMGNMFSSMTNLTSLNLSSFNTSEVTNMGFMFYGIPNLTSLDLSNFDTSKTTKMSFMFYGMRNLTALNLSSFNTSQVTDMSGMFYDMPSLTSLNLSHFDTSKVTDMHFMFRDTSSLASLDLSNFDTSKVTDMNYMFHNTSSLTSLNLSNFDTSKVTNMEAMFSDMSGLTSLDLSNFDTSQVTNMENMFSLQDEDKLNDKLETIYVNNDFDTAKVINFSAMFVNRKKLRGGNGSFLAAPGAADLSWLRVDRPGVQGYFTRKP
ncbi:MAG: BspA family leucine-rich repeat surface protein [Candidatus Nanosynbacter sp.]|nr:BspA family leucine-rich repeat surface protein [Candidatus Nanosynbacter sp.]